MFSVCALKSKRKLSAVFSDVMWSSSHECYDIFWVGLISSCFAFRRGHADAEIEAVFAKYDLDGDRILDEEEQRKMQEDLEGQKVRIWNPFWVGRNFIPVSWFKI